MTNSIADIGLADVTLIIGSNTSEAHPVISMEIIKSVKAGRTRLIVIDPRNIMMTQFADIVLNQRPGTDVAVLNGMMNWIIKKGIYDKRFVKERTEGFDELKKVVEKYTPEYVEKISGVPAAKLKKAAELYAGASKANILYAMGITQHTSGTDNVMAIADLAMLCGFLGMPGGGVNPLRGQNNVQGACDMGALPEVYSGYQRVDNEDARRRMEYAWGVSLPDTPGLKTTEMVEASYRGEIKAMYVMGENPMVSDPDLKHARAAFKKLEFLVVQDIFLTETAELADVVLPGITFAEKDGTFTNTERRVQRVQKAVRGPGEAREDWRIIRDIAKNMGYPMKHRDISDINKEISAVTGSYAGMPWETLDACGIQWPCPEVGHPGTPILHVCEFTRGRGRFIPVEFRGPAEKADKEYPLILTTGRILTHFHTGSMTRRCAPLEHLAPRAEAEFSFEDAEKYGIGDGDLVELSTRRGRVTVTARVTERMNPGVVFLPFHYAESPANVLTNIALDPVCKIPEFKVSAVKVKKKRSKARS
jgi:formate dehydrogenase major subunit/formate dehydrogenase alpha subunit